MASLSSQFPKIPSSLDERNALKIPSTISLVDKTFFALKRWRKRSG